MRKKRASYPLLGGRFYLFERGLNLADHTYGQVDKYGLLMFEEDKLSTLTFKDFRQLLAGYNAGNPSNMQVISSILTSLESQLNEIVGSNKNGGLVKSIALDTLKNLIANNGNSLTIGSSTNGSKPINFNDGVSTSTLENGTFKVNGVEVDNIRMGDFVIQSVPVGASGNHLRFLHKPVSTGGDN